MPCFEIMPHLPVLSYTLAELSPPWESMRDVGTVAQLRLALLEGKMRRWLQETD